MIDEDRLIKFTMDNNNLCDTAGVTEDRRPSFTVIKAPCTPRATEVNLIKCCQKPDIRMKNKDNTYSVPFCQACKHVFLVAVEGSKAFEYKLDVRLVPSSMVHHYRVLSIPVYK